MSATINTNNLKFVIFGSGHDYTLLDSGEGEKFIFSHPFVPLNSVNYAGQYYFQVPDEDGNFFDAVKDDLAHCTFDPALGTAFDTEGEATVEVNYHREYIHDEETIIVDKTVSQTITVVDHGTVVKSASASVLRDIYSDGYCFWRPYSVNTAVASVYCGPFSWSTQDRSITKMSNIPWRATGLGKANYTFGGPSNLADISELATADLSQCKEFYGLFASCKLLADISAVADWDVSNVEQMHRLLNGTIITDLKPLSKWNTSSLTNASEIFSGLYHCKLTGLENWNVSSVKNLSGAFRLYGTTGYWAEVPDKIDLTPLANWDVSNVEDMSGMLEYSIMYNLKGLENWNVSKVKNMQQFLYNGVNDSSKDNPLTDLSPLALWTPHLEGAGAQRMFGGAYSSATLHITGVSALSGFDVSKCTSLYETFVNCLNLTDLDGLETWDVGLVTDFRSAFSGCNSIADIEPLENWDMSSAINMSGMFNTSGNSKDATPAQNWSVSGSSMGAFNNNWTNVPAWN